MAIERKFIAQNLKEFRIKEYVAKQLSSVGLSSIKLQRTPLGDKIIVTASRPGLVVGRGGSNIHQLTDELKTNFQLENPQIEIEEVETIGLDANVIAEMIVNSFERFGSKRFKGVGHRALSDIMNAGALGAEILISGKIPSSRSRTWRFYQGYLKKCGDVAVTGVNIAYKTAVLKLGAIGVKVSILPPTTKLPDQIEIHEATIEEVTDKESKEEMEGLVEKAEKDAEKQPAEKPEQEVKKEAKKEAPKLAEKESAAEKPSEKKPEKEPAAEKLNEKAAEEKDDTKAVKQPAAEKPEPAAEKPEQEVKKEVKKESPKLAEKESAAKDKQKNEKKDTESKKDAE